MDSRDYWTMKHKKYAKESWIDKPTLFATFALEHFPKSGRLLDLGAGQGQDSRFFAKNGYDVVSTDFSEIALDLAKQKSQRENLQIEFQNLDLTNKRFPFENNTFDICYSHLSLHFFTGEQTRNIFGEIHRILKPGGIVAILLNTIDDPEVGESVEIEPELYDTPLGIVKRYFSLGYLDKLTKNLFDPEVIDAKGETYKDEIKTLVRFVGKKK